MENRHLLGAIALAVSGFFLWRGHALGALPDAAIPVVGGPDISLARCSTEKCLTVMVAPWCPHCRENEAMIKTVRDRCNARGVHARIVVTLDKPDAVREYAAALGPGTVADTGRLLHPSGVPHVYVSDGSGKILSDLAGWPITDDPALAARAIGVE